MLSLISRSRILLLKNEIIWPAAMAMIVFEGSKSAGLDKLSGTYVCRVVFGRPKNGSLCDGSLCLAG